MNISLLLYKNGKVKYIRSTNKKRFSQKLSLALKANFDKYKLVVTYKPSVDNSVVTNLKKELIKAYNAFTDPTLEIYVKGVK